jgi:hypothetical protein
MTFIILSNTFLKIAKLLVLGIKILGTIGDALITAKKSDAKKIRSKIKTYTTKRNTAPNPIQNKNVNTAKKTLWQKKCFRKRSIYGKKKIISKTNSYPSKIIYGKKNHFQSKLFPNQNHIKN